jgi:valyl-tRNA synthetase
MNLTVEDTAMPDKSKLAAEDKWILTRFNALATAVNNALSNFEVGVALAAIYEFTWDVFCDWYVELAKARLNDKGSEANETAQRVILYVLTGILKLLHPFMPFITEEIYQSLPHDAESIMIDSYPKASDELDYTDAAEDFERVMNAIKAIRARRADMNVVPSRKAKVYIATKYGESFGESSKVFFERLASASEVEVADSFDSETVSADNSVQIVTDSAVIFLPLSDIIDTEKERARLTSELSKLTSEAERIEKKLANEGFVAKAPAAVVEGERAKLAKIKENLVGVNEALAKLK